jgi:hypothetical protein
MEEPVMLARSCFAVVAIPAMLAALAAPLASAAAAGEQADKAQIDVVQPAKAGGAALPPEFTFRARVTAAEPAGKVAIHWRFGGEAQGGTVVSGRLGNELDIGQWTDAVPLISLAKNGFPPPFMKRVWFITFVAVAAEKEKPPRGKKAEKVATLTNVRMEFEFSYRGKVVKTFQEAAPDGPTVGVAIPHFRLAGGKRPDDPQFLAELSGLSDYAARRARQVESLPWRDWPLPKRLMVVSDVSGYGTAGYGVRYSNKAIVEAECRVLRQMGVNSLRAAPAFLHELAREKRGQSPFVRSTLRAVPANGDCPLFSRGAIGHAMGMPVVGYRKGRDTPAADAGCPFGPKVPELTAAAVQDALQRNLASGVPEVWALTVDEIGSVFDKTPEGKTHINDCPRCIEAFRKYVQELGAVPADFDQKDWAGVKPAYGVEDAPGATAYYSRKFNNWATAKLFTDMKTAFDEANAAKRRALEKGDTSSAAAVQPWLYSYALRGNTFLMGGHSLDFFDFYRSADNAFVYETSNRGPQVWQWDSYLCDVGRVVSTTMDKRFGIYVKPHRGAPVQRALSAVSRNATMLYWYTYGPEYFKGDSFADDPEAVALASKAAHLIGKCEDVLYGSDWQVPAEVAVIKPRCSEFLGNDAQWENAKWVYTALAHAHVPVDPIDEVMLAETDLSKYKAIYINGSHLPRRAAEKVAKYVRNGGVLWTSGWGCARDEANRPLAAFNDVLGLTDRAAAPELWYKVERYKATSLQSFSDPRAVVAPRPEGAKIVGDGPYKAEFLPAVGREVLKPGKDTRVLARFADGGAAMTVHTYGKGKAYVVGFYPGLEYSAAVRRDDFDMSRDFDAALRSFIAAPALEVTRPVVWTSEPTVEGVLLSCRGTAKKAIVLMNWTYRGGPPVGIVAPPNLKVSIRHGGSVKKVTSAMLDQSLPVVRKGDAVEVTLPRLDEGDVLILD